MTRLQEEMTRLVEPQIPALRRYARLFTRDPDGADDLVQDCLERALLRWRSRQPDRDVRPWLFAILHNIAVDRIRAARRQGAQVPLDEMDESLSAERPSQEDTLHRRDVLRHLDSLPEEQRTVLLLIAVEELSYGEAADVLQVPVGTIMSRLHRAREKLHRAMTHDPKTGAPGTGTPSASTLRIVQ